MSGSLQTFLFKWHYINEIFWKWFVLFLPKCKNNKLHHMACTHPNLPSAVRSVLCWLLHGNYQSSTFPRTSPRLRCWLLGRCPDKKRNTVISPSLWRSQENLGILFPLSSLFHTCVQGTVVTLHSRVLFSVVDQVRPHILLDGHGFVGSK